MEQCISRTIIKVVWEYGNIEKCIWFRCVNLLIVSQIFGIMYSEETVHAKNYVVIIFLTNETQQIPQLMSSLHSEPSFFLHSI
jgi:hypothetical protein